MDRNGDNDGCQMYRCKKTWSVQLERNRFLLILRMMIQTMIRRESSKGRYGLGWDVDRNGIIMNTIMHFFEKTWSFQPERNASLLILRMMTMTMITKATV